MAATVSLVTTLVLVTSLSRPSAAQGCGMTYHGPSGSFESVNYPGDYNNSLQCRQTFQVEDGAAVELTFENFDVEYSNVCLYDKVEIYDGQDDQSPLLAVFCGSELPMPVRSTGRHLSLYLVSDNSITGSGFNGTYRSVDIDNTTTANQPIEITTSEIMINSTTTECGQTNNGTQGNFMSFGYPNDYINNLNCSQIFEVEDGKAVQLTFMQFDVEYNEDCIYDKVKIYDGPDSLSPLLATFCGSNVPQPVRSTGRHLSLYLITDGSVTRRGFYGFYMAVDQVTHPDCGMHHHGPSGAFKSVNFPNDYLNNLYCLQQFHVEDGEVVELTFETFDVEQHGGYDCFDRVFLYDGPDDQSPLLEELCGVHVPPPVRSTGNYLSLYLHTDNTETRQGFNGTYRALSLGGMVNSTFSPPLDTMAMTNRLENAETMISSVFPDLEFNTTLSPAHDTMGVSNPPETTETPTILPGFEPNTTLIPTLDTEDVANPAESTETVTSTVLPGMEPNTTLSPALETIAVTGEPENTDMSSTLPATQTESEIIGPSPTSMTDSESRRSSKDVSQSGAVTKDCLCWTSAFLCVFAIMVF